MITHEYFEAAYQVAKQFPDHELILCHAGIPVVSKLDDYQQAWRAALRKLAQAPNVVVKISGLSSGSPANFYAVTMRQWIRECVETFGPERCMFGSNFHVDGSSSRYQSCSGLIAGRLKITRSPSRRGCSRAWPSASIAFRIIDEA